MQNETPLLRNRRLAITLTLSLLLLGPQARSESPSNGEPTKTPAPTAMAYPALGVSAERKVDVSWNRYYSHAGLSDIWSA
jgi:hypothetical protein